MRRKRELQPGPFGLTLEELPKPVTSLALFGEEGPLELEIGSGKGTFLIGESKRRPETHFLGVEYARRYWLFAGDRLRRHDCTNSRAVLADATELIGGYIEDVSLAGIHIYFPDPWPKKRHHKRRLVQEGFIELLVRKMIRGARLQIATDHADYFEQIEDVLERSELDIVPFDTTAAANDEEIVGSNFERKYRQQRRTVHAIAALKRDLKT